MSYRTPLLSAALLLLAGCPEDEVPPGLEDCRNEIDDDRDGDVDCDDSDCAASCVEICDNGIDDDGNGLTDCADEPCFSPVCGEVCGDGLDNDLDNRIDCDDSDCAGQCPERCDDSIDNDGDGAADCVDDDCLSFCDSDGDGYFDANVGYDDCDDDDPLVNPAADEVCNEYDDDCDGLIDDEDSNLRGDQTWYRDADGDGFGTGKRGLLTCEAPPNTANNNTDCDDNDPTRSPGTPEICNGFDDNCDKLIDEQDPNLDPASLRTFYVDADGDGFGDAADPGVTACTPPSPGLVTNADDCDDTDSRRNPGNVERTCDGIDNDCDPATIDDDGLDSDGDGFTFCEGDCDDTEATANPDGVEVTCTGIDEDCRPQTPDEIDEDGDGYSLCDLDCDDTRATVNPGANEIQCNGRDDDCDPVGTPDDDGIDADGDSYTVCLGDCDDNDPNAYPGNTEIICTGVDEDCVALTTDTPDDDSDGVSVCAGDCDDDNPQVNPNRPEQVCDGLDNDCDPYTLDDGDADADGVDICEGDCDDTNPDAFPGNTETQCDGADNDCLPGTPDDQDQDGDGVSFCELDCDDTNPQETPGRPETQCDGFDNDCDPATVDDPGDEDGDGFLACVDDCDDTNPYANPGEAEVTCNMVDEDCSAATPDEVDEDGDGLSCYIDCDDNDPYANALSLWGIDSDGDGFYEEPGIESCNSPGVGYVQVEEATDCDDIDPQVNPEARDLCEDGVDQDCSGDDYTPCDTAADFFFRGDAVVDNGFVGTESIVVEGRNSRHVFCDFMFQTIDWDNDPSVGGNPPLNPNTCTDADGNNCQFAFAVNLSDPQPVDGDCALFGLVTPYPNTITRGWGYIDDYQFAGNSYGPLPMYYFAFAPYYDWLGLLSTAEFDPADNSFFYDVAAGSIPAPY